MGKAFDDRLGVFVIMETLRYIKKNKIVHPNKIFGCATVQEEVGARGAKTVAHLIDPDIALVIEVDISGDVPGIEFFSAAAKMGEGPSLVTYDRSMIPNQPLKEFILQTAEQSNIPLQLSQSARGGTDAGQIHINRIGCPSIVIGVPTRHIHSHVGVVSIEDLWNTVKLVSKLIQTLDKKTVENFTQI
jgi:endoglucanase